MKRLGMFCIVTINLILSGCINYHFNASYPREQQQNYYNRDNAQCSNVALGYAPMPQINYTPTSYQTSGHVTITDGGKTYNGRYNSYTYSTDYTASFVNGMNLANALITPFRQESISNNCMAALGWYKTKHKYDLPPPEGNIYIKEIASNLTKNGFANLRYTNNQYFMIRSIDSSNPNEIRMVIAELHQNGKTFGKKHYMYAIADWGIVNNKTTAFIDKYTAYDLQNNVVLEETTRTKSFDVSPGSALDIYLRDYDLL